MVLPDTILLACGRQNFRRGRRVGDLKDECLDGEQAALKYFRRSGMSPSPHRFVRCVDYKATYCR
jgi:hypothetical protein